MGERIFLSPRFCVFSAADVHLLVMVAYASRLNVWLKELLALARHFFGSTWFCCSFLIIAFVASWFACGWRNFLLLRQKKVTKEKAPPGSLESPLKNSSAKAPA